MSFSAEQFRCQCLTNYSVQWKLQLWNYYHISPSEQRVNNKVHSMIYTHGSRFVLCLWLDVSWFYPYRSGLLHWHWGNHTIMPVFEPWRMWVSSSNLSLKIRIYFLFDCGGYIINTTIKNTYRKTSDISRTLVDNKIVDHSAPVGAAPTTYSLST